MNSFVIVPVVIVGVLAATVVAAFLLGRLVASNNAKRARRAVPPAGPHDYEESVVGLTSPFRASGLLRLTPDQVLFANGSTGDVLAIDRSIVVACVASEDVPTGSGMQTLRRKALVLQLDDPTLPQGVGFMVSDPTAWVQRLRR